MNNLLLVALAILSVVFAVGIVAWVASDDGCQPDHGFSTERC